MNKSFNPRRIAQFLLLFADIASWLFSIFLALMVRNASVPSAAVWSHHALWFLPLCVYSVCALYLLGLYVVDRPLGRRRIMLGITSTCLAGWALGFVLFYFFISNVNFPKTILLLYWLVWGSCAWLWRVIVRKVAERRRIPVVFLGNGPSVEPLCALLTANPMLGYVPVAVCGEGSSGQDLETVSSAYPDALYVWQFKVPLGISKELHSLTAQGCPFMPFTDFYEYIERKVPLEDISETWFLSGVDLGGKRAYFMVKRSADILLSIIAFILTFWLWPFIAILIKLEDKGPVFFVQKREGRESKGFNLYKFRTMVTEGNDGSETVKNDRRITRVGRILRAARLDELPQLLNVLRGDMSLIGPRPERPELAAGLERQVPWYRQRLLVRPGITGWDQVCGEYHSPSSADTYKKLQNDLYYIKNCSVALDVSIIFKTLSTMLKREGR